MTMRSEASWPGALFRLDAVDSTNSEAVRRIHAGDDGEDFAVVAATQTAGRGRLQRSWESTPGLGLYLTIACRPRVAPEFLPQSTLLAAVATSRAIARVCGVAPAIKWPNDLYHDGRKVGGILSEAVWDRRGSRFMAAVGIGINVHHRADDFPRELRRQAVSLRQMTGRTVDASRLAVAILDDFHGLRLVWEERGFAEIRGEWLAMDCTVGKTVSVPNAPQTKAVVTGISEFGELLLETRDGEILSVIADDIAI